MLQEPGLEHVDLKTWPRAKHLAFFRDFENPHFHIVADVDITVMHGAAGASGRSRFAAMLHAVTWVANSIPELRTRIRGEAVVRHRTVHPSFTTLVGEQYEYRGVRHDGDFDRFEAAVGAELKRPSDGGLGAEGLDVDDLLYVSCVPWVHFTGFQHASWRPRVDSIPRITWGRFSRIEGARGTRVVTPVSIQVHHGLADGLHVGRFFEGIEARVNDTTWLTRAPEGHPAR